MDPVTSRVDYEHIDAPKHFMDFKNLSNFDNDDADQWFDQHTEDGFEDAFLPNLETPPLIKHPLVVKANPHSVTVKQEPNLSPKNEQTPQVVVKTEPHPTEVASDNDRVREELQQIERREEPEDRETFVISKGAKKGKQAPYSPRPQPTIDVAAPVKPEPAVSPPRPVVKEEIVSPISKSSSSVEATPTSDDTHPTEATPTLTEEPVVKEEIASPPKSTSPKKAVPVIKQTSFKANSKSQRSAAKKAISCIHSILSPKKPTPRKATTTSSEVKASQSTELVREVKLSGPQSKKTYEELQLEEVKRLQNETRKKLRASRRSFANLSKTSAPVRVKGTMPTTEPVEFHFHQTNREKKGMVVKGRKSDCAAPQQFLNSLRHTNKADNYNPNMPSTKPPTPPGGTKVKPFKFHLDERLKHKHNTPTTSSDPTHSTSDSASFRSTAEFVSKYHKATPPRFRRTVKKPASTEKSTRTVSLTIPKTPLLTTKTRARPVTVKSTTEEEEEELKRIRQYQFQAKPINPDVFRKKGLMGVPKKITQHSLIPPQTPELATKKRCLERREKGGEENQEQEVVFHAKPMPDFNKVTGLPAKKELPLTQPATPSINLKRRRLHEEDEEEESSKRAKTEFRANPMPDFENVLFKPQPEERPATKPEPFSFEERDKGKPTRESFVEMILRKEKPAPFKAQPIPDFGGGPTVPPKKELPPTKPQPFNLLSDVRGQKYISKLQEKLHNEVMKAKEDLEFKASEASVLYERPFLPRQSYKPLTNPEDIVLSTEVRSSQRAEFNEKLQEEAQHREEENLRRKALREIQEVKEITEYRKSLVHKAQPIKQYTGVTVARSDKPITQPISPHFHTDSRMR